MAASGGVERIKGKIPGSLQWNQHIKQTSWPSCSSQLHRSRIRGPTWLELTVLHWKCCVAVATLCTHQTKGCKAIFTDRRSVSPETEFLHGSECRSRLHADASIMLWSSHMKHWEIFCCSRMSRLNLHFKLKGSTSKVKGQLCVYILHRDSVALNAEKCVNFSVHHSTGDKIKMQMNKEG